MQYEPEKPSPAIFIFEPMARGKIGIQPFISVAEQYGYILICSNNSKNGPYDLNLTLTNNYRLQFNKDLEKKEDSEDRQESKMYKRLLYKIFAHAIETVRYDNSIKTIQQSMFCYDICILVYPDYALPYCRQIQYSNAIGEKDKSLDYL